MLEFAMPFQLLFFSFSVLNVYLHNILEITFFRLSLGYEVLFKDKYFSEILFRIIVLITMSV